MGRIILVDDITERVTLETQLAQADKLSSIGLLAAGVAHEINTPLAVISSYAQMLSKQLRGDARLGPVLDKITQQSFRAAEIANGLLNFSRTSTTEFRATDLNQVIRDTLSLLEHQFKTAQIDVDLDLADDLPPIHGNPGKLQQVFLNLLLNAKEAMPGGGSLRISTLVNGHVEALITDSGSRHRARAPQAHLRSLLHHQDHAQAGRQARHRPGPLRLLRHHSGARRQNSCRERRRRRHNLPSRVSPAKEFCTCLSVRDQPLNRARSRVAPSTATPDRRHPASILVIDDEASIRESLEVLLSLEGYSATMAADGEEGLRMIETE